ncbi:hypothetical protein [Burkholderia sp. GS2Y]|uniref:CBM6 domain-containing protein n=1 Tax=Burkholderia theae TaxID=3143496 RepID=A0ABU9WEM1_9BURK
MRRDNRKGALAQRKIHAAMLCAAVLQSAGLAHAACPANFQSLQFSDPGFESAGATGYACPTSWTVTSGAGCASNNPHGGGRAAFLNGGEGYSVSQTVTAPVAGNFDLSAWIATSANGTGGTFSVQVAGQTVQSVTLPSTIANSNYIKYTLPHVAVAANQAVTIVFTSSSGRAWINVDDIEVVPSAPNDPQLSSDNTAVVALFNWAKVKANSWTRLACTTGVTNQDESHPSGQGVATYAPSYWAGYPFRSYYYGRDFAHQFVGAHMLGLDAQNKAMLAAFAATANTARGGYPVWALNFDGSIGLTDYSSDTSFVRELPAPFELAQRIADGYRWTGDADYAASGGPFYAFVTNTAGTFVDTHYGPLVDGTANGRQVKVAQESGADIWAGVASYNEGAPGNPVEAADALSSQYRAYVAMQQLATAAGDTTTANTYATRAGDLKTYYNAPWSVVSSTDSTDVVRSYDPSAVKSIAWGGEMSWFPPMKGIMNPGTRRDQYMGWLNTTALGQAPANLEAVTYLPDAFFAVHDGTTAWAWMQYVYNRINDVHGGYGNNFVNGDYPEVSFTLVGQAIAGLLGVEPDASAGKLTTTSQLPATGMAWLQVSHIPIGAGKVTVRHDGATRSTLANENPAGGTSYAWHARFAGVYPTVVVNGVARAANTEQPEGSGGPTYTYVDVTVAPQGTAVVQVSK